MHCGCADIIVPPGNSWTNVHLFPMKSEEALNVALHQDADPQGNASRDVLECGCLVNSLNNTCRIEEGQKKVSRGLCGCFMNFDKKEFVIFQKMNTFLQLTARSVFWGS